MSRKPITVSVTRNMKSVAYEFPLGIIWMRESDAARIIYTEYITEISTIQTSQVICQIAEKRNVEKKSGTIVKTMS